LADEIATLPSLKSRLVGGALVASEQTEARVFFGFHDGMLIALHAIIKKARKTSAEDLGLAKQRLKEIQSWRET